jgi:hypothetical protein
MMFPGLPESGKPWFFTENEYRIAKQRMDVEGVRPSGKINKTMLRRVFRSWKWFLAFGSYTMYVPPPPPPFFFNSRNANDFLFAVS